MVTLAEKCVSPNIAANVNSNNRHTNDATDEITTDMAWELRKCSGILFAFLIVVSTRLSASRTWSTSSNSPSSSLTTSQEDRCFVVLFAEFVCLTESTLVTSSPLRSPIRRTTNILFENLFLFQFHCHTRSTFISYLDLAFRWAVEREICIENCKLCRDKRQSNTRENRKKLQGESRFIGSVMGRHGAVRLTLFFFWSKLLFCSIHNSHCQVKDSRFAKQILCVAAKNKHTTKCDERATRRWFEM